VDPDLVATWKAILADGAGLVVALLLGVLLGIARAGARRPKRPAPELLRLRRAVARGDEAQVAAAADDVARHLGEEAVDDLLAALGRDLGVETRRAVAAALFRLGRGLTAEVEMLPAR
jgi:hypothetical protein